MHPYNSLLISPFMPFHCFQLLKVILLADDSSFLCLFCANGQKHLYFNLPLYYVKIAHCKFFFYFLHLAIYHGVHSPSGNRLLPHSFIELHITSWSICTIDGLPTSPCMGICLFSNCFAVVYNVGMNTLICMPFLILDVYLG